MDTGSTKNTANTESPLLGQSPVDSVPVYQGPTENPICKRATQSIAVGAIGLLLMSVNGVDKGFFGRSGWFDFILSILGAMLISGVAAYIRPRGWAAACCIGLWAGLCTVFFSIMLPGTLDRAVALIGVHMWEWLIILLMVVVFVLCLPISYAYVRAAYDGRPAPATVAVPLPKWLVRRQARKESTEITRSDGDTKGPEDNQ